MASKRGRKAGNYAQTERVLRLLDFLRSRHYGATYAELAERFDVTERQVRRDLEVIENAGLRLDRLAAADGRVKVCLRDAQARAVKLTQRERYGLLAARRVFDVLEGTPFEEDVESIFGKLAGSLPDDERAELERFGERFIYVPEGGTKSYLGKDDVLDALFTGTLKRLRVRFRYRATDAEVRAGLLEPYAVVLYKQGLYVVGAALDEAGARRARRPHVYAVERFEAAEFVRGAPFEVPKSFRAERYFDGAFGLYLGDAPAHVVVEFEPAARALVTARTWHRTQRLTDLPSGGVRMEMDVSSLTQVHTWVLGWGPLARAVAPPALVERMAREVAGLASIYGQRAAGRRSGARQ